MMRHGKKNTAQKIFDDMLSKLKVAQLSGDVSLGDRRGADPSKPPPCQSLRLIGEGMLWKVRFARFG